MKRESNPPPCRIIPSSSGWLKILRIGLLLSSIGWGISFFFTFASWNVATEQLRLMGAGTIIYSPLLDYWMRMASAAFGCIGIASALACYRPVFFQSLVMLLAPFHAFLGVVLAASACMNDLNADSHPTFAADITFCFVTAAMIGIPVAVTALRKPASSQEAS